MPPSSPNNRNRAERPDEAGEIDPRVLDARFTALFERMAREEVFSLGQAVMDPRLFVFSVASGEAQPPDDDLPPEVDARSTAIIRQFFRSLQACTDRLRQEDGPAAEARRARFFRCLQEEFFRCPQYLVEYLPPHEMLLLGARATRDADARDGTGDALAGELGYLLVHAGTALTRTFERRIHALSVPEAMDCVRFLRTLLVQSANQEEGRAIACIRDVLTALQEKHRSRLVRYAAGLVLESFARPVPGMVSKPDREKASRSDVLRRQIDVELRPGERLDRIGSDAIAVLGYGGVPSRFAYIAEDDLPPPHLQDLRPLRDVSQLLHRSRLPQPVAVAALSHALGADGAQVLDRLRAALPGVDDAAWAAYLRFCDAALRFQEAQERQTERFSRVIKERQDPPIAAFVGRWRERADTLRDRADPGVLRQFTEAADAGRTEEAYLLLHELLRPHARHPLTRASLENLFSEPVERNPGDPDDRSEAWRALQGELEELRRFLQQAARTGVEDLRAQMLRLREERDLFAVPAMPVMGAITEDKERIMPILRDAADTPLEAARADMACPAFRRMDVFARDPLLNPFPAKDAQLLPLLASAVLQPDMRALVEKDLGIRFAEIPLRTSVQLLRFLQDAKDDSFDALREVLRAHPDDASSILTCFLSCAQNLANGAKVLELAGHPDCLPALRAYAHHAATADDAARVITRLHREAATGGGKHDEQDFYRSLLARGNMLLGNLSDKIRQGDAPEKAVAAFRGLIASEDESVTLTRNLVECLPREDRAHLDLFRLRTTALMPAIPGAAVRKHPLWPELRAMIADAFGDDVREFEETFLTDVTARVLYAHCQGHVLALFGLTELPHGIAHSDWLATKRDGAVRGLALATWVSIMRRQPCPEGVYGVCEPIALSSTMVIEQLGWVAFEDTEEGEYGKGKYLRMRLMPEEKGAYVSKDWQNDGTQMQAVRLFSDFATEEPEEIPGCREEVRACRVRLRKTGEGENAEIDQEPVFRLLRSLRKETGKDWVLTRYVPAEGNTQDDQAHYCVFEPCALDRTPQGIATKRVLWDDIRWLQEHRRTKES